jgi:hypothetical protein
LKAEKLKQMQPQSEQTMALFIKYPSASIGSRGTSPVFEITEEDLLAPDELQ